MTNENDDFGWIVSTVLGVAGVLGAYIFSTMNNSSPPNINNPGLPPPPMNGKPASAKPCGCNAGKK